MSCPYSIPCFWESSEGYFLPTNKPSDAYVTQQLIELLHDLFWSHKSYINEKCVKSVSLGAKSHFLYFRSAGAKRIAILH